MTRPLVFATRNPGKLRELRELVTDLDVIDVPEAARRIGRAIPEVDEDAGTLAGNAIKKAREVALATSLPALADDSGLEVDALDGGPGVYSARYAGPAADAAANNAKLLAALAGIPAERRGARFRCVLALADPAGPLGDEVITAEGRCDGAILDAPRGTGGFGYDPLFLLAGRSETMAELAEGEKSRISHRARAMQAIEKRLRAYCSSY